VSEDKWGKGGVVARREDVPALKVGKQWPARPLEVLGEKVKRWEVKVKRREEKTLKVRDVGLVTRRGEGWIGYLSAFEWNSDINIGMSALGYTSCLVLRRGYIGVKC
jgi:hypothetical protein